MKSKKVISTKVLALVLAGGLIAGGTIGGTLAWLLDKTETVTNTFTVGNVDITLKESPYNVDDGTYGEPKEGTTNTYPAIPGATYKKDPVVTVEANSEDCWLFVEFIYSKEADKYLNYSSNLKSTDWTQIGSTTENEDGTKTEVWARTSKVEKSGEDQSWPLLADLSDFGNGITLEIDSAAVTNQTMTTAAAQKLEWKAYAVQADSLKDDKGTAITTAQDAWAIAKSADSYTPTESESTTPTESTESTTP